MFTFKIIEETSVQTTKKRGLFPKMNMIDFWISSHNGWEMKFLKYNYAIYRLIANFLQIKNVNRSYSQKWTFDELQEEMLQLLGGLTAMQYY